jgi:hypothetical protein
MLCAWTGSALVRSTHRAIDALRNVVVRKDCMPQSQYRIAITALPIERDRVAMRDVLAIDGVPASVGPWLGCVHPAGRVTILWKRKAIGVPSQNDETSDPDPMSPGIRLCVRADGVRQ